MGTGARRCRHHRAAGLAAGHRRVPGRAAGDRRRHPAGGVRHRRGDHRVQRLAVVPGGPRHGSAAAARRGDRGLLQGAVPQRGAARRGARRRATGRCSTAATKATSAGASGPSCWNGPPGRSCWSRSGSTVLLTVPSPVLSAAADARTGGGRGGRGRRRGRRDRAGRLPAAAAGHLAGRPRRAHRSRRDPGRPAGPAQLAGHRAGLDHRAGRAPGDVRGGGPGGRLVGLAAAPGAADAAGPARDVAAAEHRRLGTPRGCARRGRSRRPG